MFGFTERRSKASSVLAAGLLSPANIAIAPANRDLVSRQTAIQLGEHIGRHSS